MISAALRFQVFDRTNDADDVEAGVRKEALVLGGKDGVAQYGRDIVIADEALFFAIAVVQIGDQLRFEIVARAFGIVAQGNDAVDAIVREADGGRLLAEVGFDAGKDIDGVRLHGVIAGGVFAVLAVTGTAQSSGDIAGRGRVANVDGFGRGVYARSSGEGSAFQAFVNDLGVLVVVVDERAAAGDHAEQHNHQQDLADRVHQEPGKAGALDDAALFATAALAGSTGVPTCAAAVGWSALRRAVRGAHLF